MPIKTLQIPTPDGVSDAFAAFPDGGGPHPGVLMYPDGFGIRPVIRDMAEELAGTGYYVLVPNAFYRRGPAPVLDLPEHIGAEDRAVIFAELMPMIKAHTTELVLRDAAAYLEFLAAQPDVAVGPVAVTGYCIGGLWALHTAAAHPDRVAAFAGFHSPVVADEPDDPDALHRLLSRIRARVHLGHAASDLTPEALAELNGALDAAGLDYTSEIYAGSVHGYTMADTDVFSPDAARQHWERLLALLDRSLTARGTST